MKYSPIKIWLIIALTLLGLYLMTYLSRSEKRENGTISEGFSLSEVEIKYPTTESFLNQQAENTLVSETVDSLVSNIEELVVETKVKKTDVKSQIPDLRKIDTSKVQRINYPADKKAFIDHLKDNLTSKECRIIHYGDSQIEGDRISAYLRNRLQSFYGGNGPGFIPIKQVYEQISAVVTPSENWERYAYFDPTQDRFEHKAYGAYVSLSRFTAPVASIDSIDTDTLDISVAKINVGIPEKSFRSLRKFSSIGLHYGNSLTPTSIEVKSNGAIIKSGQLINDGQYHNYHIDLPDTPSSLEITLTALVSPDFYGITLDGKTGISLDNVAMRGSSGTVFAGSNGTVFQNMLRSLNPKLLIFQYGGNSVPYLKDSVEVKNYAKYLTNHLKWVKRKAPEAQVLFIGPSDMSTKQNGELITYPLLPFVNETLKNVCIENGFAYWSIYDAMGGKNSMRYWVEQKLAGEDYTHFSPSGTKIISELLFLSLYLDLKESQ